MIKHHRLTQALLDALQEVANLQDNTARLNRKLAAGVPISEAEALREALNSNDGLMSERNKVRCGPFW